MTAARTGIDDPTVSVVLAVYNGAATLTRSVRSLADQTLPPHEIIVVDDASTDATPDVLAELEREIPGVRSLSMPSNQGAAVALNAGIAEATGTYVAIADDDDVAAPRRLEHSVALLEHTGADMAGGQVDGVMWGPLRFAVSRFPVDAASIAERVAAGLDPLPHVTMMLRRSVIDHFGAYRRLRRGEDLELMLRWARLGAHIAVSNEVLATYTFRPEFFSIGTQTRWMLFTKYARDIATLPDDEVPEFQRWFVGQAITPARREARRRVGRLAARLAVGTLVRRN